MYGNLGSDKDSISVQGGERLFSECAGMACISSTLRWLVANVIVMVPRLQWGFHDLGSGRCMRCM